MLPKFLLRPLWVLFVLLALYPRADAQELRRLHYGTTTSTAHLPIWAAKDAGLFAKNGLNVEPVQIRGGALITMGIMSGQLQFSGAGAESIVAARIEGGDVVLLACPVDSDPVYLIARPEIKSPAELKGKATAVTRLGSTTHFYLRAALRQVGLDPEKDVTILQLGTGTEPFRRWRMAEFRWRR
jgi:ABC-type nitrate/sulfonate/bicarbonate transport system substrate-binding protein